GRRDAPAGPRARREAAGQRGTAAEPAVPRAEDVRVHQGTLRLSRGALVHREVNERGRRMKAGARGGVVILACGLSAAAAAADFDGSTPLTCASTEVFECDAGGA